LISGVCDSTSPVKAKVMLIGLLVVVVVVVVDEVVVIDVVVPEVVAVAQPVVMQANANVN
jgi:hypothetical protein